VTAILTGLLVAFGAGQLVRAGEAQPIPEFTEAFLHDPANIERGREIWEEQCRHCHGKDAYPGKAPKLTPRRYTPAFVYHRVTYGFRGMPAWKDVYSEEERMAVVAWVLSEKFSP
jgi:mono/diheme cytochrome c family protein